MTFESEPTVVRAFLTLFEADVAWSAIDAADITATLADDNLIRLNFWYSNALGGVKLVVPAPLAEEAIAILDTRAQPVEGEMTGFHASRTTRNARVVAAMTSTFARMSSCLW